jgi:ubiquinone/menaquinone biosynthesis C-methylase UbiE
MEHETTGWTNEDTARAYAEFCSRHSMYAVTSAGLVALAQVGGDQTVLDLACGTGQTTQVILSRLGPGGVVHCVDASNAMLCEGRRSVTDPRAQWHLAKAEAIGTLVEDADVVICNSAIWQTDMAATFAAVHSTLRPGGVFACNIGRQAIMMPFTEEELNPPSASLGDLMQAFAIIDHGHVPRPRPGERGLSVERVTRLLVDAGLEVLDTPEFSYEQSIECHRDWLSIPIFTERIFPDLTVDQRQAALASAFERVDRRARTTRWVAFLARRPPS